MKAQISIEYIISVIVFILFATYIFFRVIVYPAGYINEIKTQRLKSEAYQISELLVNDPGEPLDWNIKPDNERIRIGLSDSNQNKTNFLSMNKIAEFNDTCNTNYDEIKRLIGTDYQFSIFLSSSGTASTRLINCSYPGMVVKPVKFEVSRIVAFDSTYGELIVELW